MKHFESKNVKCPLYMCETATALHCTSQDDDTWLHICFRTTSIKSQYKALYCNRLPGYEKCPYCKSIFEAIEGSELNNKKL